MSRQSGNSLRCHFWASATFPAANADTSFFMSAGTMLPTTETTPLPPMLMSGRVRLSSPDRMVTSVRLAICEARSSEPVASFTATIVGYASANRAIVSGRIVDPVRPGMLYNTCGRSQASATAPKWRKYPSWVGLL